LPSAVRATVSAVAGTILFRMLLGLVLLAPLPLGSVYALSWGLAGAIAGLLLLGQGALALAGAEALAPPGIAVWSWLPPFLAAALWAALQAAAFSPGEWHHPLWPSAAAVLETPLAGAVSLDPPATLATLLRLLSYAGVFWLALHLCHSRTRAETVFRALAFAGVAYAAYGLADKFSGADLVLWYPKPLQYAGAVTSTFINRNNYATYAGLGLVCASGMIIKILVEAMAAPGSRRRRTFDLLEVLSGWRWLLLPGWVLLLTALLLTGSRGGVLSTLAALLALLSAFAAAARVERRHALILALVFGLGGGALIAFSGGGVAERLSGQALENEERPIIYELTAQAIAERPWLGTGFGTFADAFRLVRDARVTGFWDKAHDTYLENALELGVPAASLLALSLAALAAQCVRGLRLRGRGAAYPAIGIAATVLVACHSLVDFGLQIPAIAMTYALIMGAAVAQVFPPQR
jgi:O-antigen ligase